MVFRNVALLLFLSTACAQSLDGPDAEPLPDDTDFPIAIQILPTSVDPGSIIDVRMENNSAIAVGFNLCLDGVLERASAGGWVALSRLPYPCPLPLYGIDPATSLIAPFGVPSDAVAGTYRLRIRFVALAGDQSIVRRSNSFLVD